MTAAMLVIGLMVLGLLLIVVEILVLPGVGLIGVLGVGGVIGSVVTAYSQLSPTFAFAALVGGVVASTLLFWLLPKTRAARSMILEVQQLGTAADPRLHNLIGRAGKALTPLRPSGSVDIDDRPVDVVTDGEYIDTGTRVEVVEVEGSRVVVKPLD